MRLINNFNLIHGLMQGKKPDSIQILSQIDRNKLLKNLQKTKEGVPKPFKFSNAPMEEENLSKMRQRDKENLWKIYARIPKRPDKELLELFKLKEKYPDVPAIYNYIAVAYAYNGQKEKHFNAIQETIQRFPDYLFGKIALAEYYLNKGEHKKVPNALNKQFEIHMHFSPSVKVFHFSEARSFYSVIGRYYLRANKINRALFCYFILADMQPEHVATKQLSDEIILREIEDLRKKIQNRRYW